ncbi:hypothetical protein BDU57DRAFT_459866 [Ampelomyces quisqualis]|uniref:Uncharacterized protein n=1 Tax=Ampelomyces quisqualis TaxID=50730 RepID=A0A6A5Q9N5_AMPQU|nr:hypothetical protein BDU57DRAFT_459866 [Ampelomyces quisqualis]
MSEEQSTPFVAQQLPQPLVSKNITHAHKYRIPGNDRGDVELGTQGPLQLQGCMAEETRLKPQKLNGYVGPAMIAYDGRAVEMPLHAVLP